MSHRENRRNTVDLHKVGVRQALPPRNEPYWRAVRPRCALGYRKSVRGGVWKARYHDENGDQRYKTLGHEADMDYAAALKVAEEWWTGLGAGVSHRALTVKDAVDKYLDHRFAMSGEDATERDRGRFKQVLFGSKFAEIPLDKLRAADIEEWRNSLVTESRSKQTVNRVYRSFRAAMNYAFKQRLIATRPWEAVDAFPVREGSRQTYLPVEQRRELLNAADDDLRAFLKALLYTAARPGEMEKAKVGDLDLATNTLRLVSSKGRGGQERIRHLPLAGAALEFFKGQAKDKPKSAPLVAPQGWSRTQWSRALRALVDSINEQKEDKALPTGIVCYDMRHIAISDWLQAGLDIGTVAKLAGTSVVMIDKHYHKFIRTQVQDRLAAVAAF